jgi:hypothetical protein
MAQCQTEAALCWLKPYLFSEGPKVDLWKRLSDEVNRLESRDIDNLRPHDGSQARVPQRVAASFRRAL